MCAGGGTPPEVPLQNRTDAELQKIVELGSYVVDPTKNMLTQLAVVTAKAKAPEAQRNLDLRAEQRRLAAERTTIAAQQQSEMERLQQAQQQAAADQEQQVAGLRLQEQQQQQQIAASRLATNAATASMRVLQTPLGKAPTAAMARGPRTAAQRRGTNSSQLRIGGTAAAPGVGLNIGA